MRLNIFVKYQTYFVTSHLYIYVKNTKKKTSWKSSDKAHFYFFVMNYVRLIITLEFCSMCYQICNYLLYILTKEFFLFFFFWKFLTTLAVYCIEIMWIVIIIYFALHNNNNNNITAPLKIVLSRLQCDFTTLLSNLYSNNNKTVLPKSNSHLLTSTIAQHPVESSNSR